MRAELEPLVLDTRIEMLAAFASSKSEKMEMERR